MEITEEVGKDAEGENLEEMMEPDDKQNEPESKFSLFYYNLLRSSDDIYIKCFCESFFFFSAS